MIASIVAFVCVLIVRILFGYLSTKYEVLKDWIPWFTWITVALAVVAAVFIVIEVVNAIKKKRNK